MPPSRTDSATSDTGGTAVFFALACASTWLLALPTNLAWMQHRMPAPLAIAGAGGSAFGPLLAALVVAGRRRQLAQVFGRWRSNPAWILLALAGAPVIHALSTALFVAIGGRPTQWFYPPDTQALVAALIVFPLGEEFGWRGFAHPRLVARFGTVRGCLILGALWGVWHLGYCVSPDDGRFDVLGFAITVTELPFYAVLLGWLFERANRSMAVAIAGHMGAHLDKFDRAPRHDLRLQIVHLFVVAGIAVVAGGSLARRARPGPAQDGYGKPGTGAVGSTS
jgi:membrane protease YdiL (CAAX protease family)